MKNRSSIYGLAVLFLAVTAAETWSQECKVSCHRPATLIDLFQQRLCNALCDCDSTSKSRIQRGVAAEKAAPVPKTMFVQEAIPVQKTPFAQKSGCQREVSDIVLDCEPCSISRPRPVASLLSRWKGSLPRVLCPLVSVSPSKGGKGDGKAKDHPRPQLGCGCKPDLQTDYSQPIPMIEKPQIDNNPFQDDALQPAPLPGAPTRQARVLPRTLTDDPTDSTHQQPVVRYASYYQLSVQADGQE